MPGGSPVYAGSSFDPGRQIVVPALARAGIRKLDLVVNSHPHEDHLGGVPAVLDNIQVGRYIAPPQEHTTPLVLKVQELLEEKKIPVSYVKTGAEINLDSNVKISVLGPPQTLFSGTRSDANNNSLVLHITYGKVSILLTGDLEQEGMLDLVSRFQGSNGIQADLLKCPHHGSSYSICPEFAAAIKPQLVVISVGRNSFGHPDAQTIRFWQEQGARVLRTDEDGHITILTDGANLIMPGT
jgi:competence protein ComEC